MPAPGRPTRTRTPGFLIIGAMKAGTTTLFHDLNNQAGVFIHSDKEPDTLIHHDGDAVLAEYDRMLAGAPADALCGDASTGYSKLPTHPGVVDKAYDLLGPDLKLMYLVRHPVDRLLSHYHHVASEGSFTGTLGEALDGVPGITDYSRYAMQVRPWIERFGPDAVQVVVFEQYVKTRAETVARLCAFLGIGFDAERVFDRAYNVSDGKPLVKGLMRNTQFMWPYRKLIRPLLPLSARAKLVRLVSSGAPPRLRKMPADVFERVRDTLEQDQRALAELCGWDAAPWDLSVFVQDSTPPASANPTPGDARP